MLVGEYGLSWQRMACRRLILAAPEQTPSVEFGRLLLRWLNMPVVALAMKCSELSRKTLAGSLLTGVAVSRHDSWPLLVQPRPTKLAVSKRLFPHRPSPRRLLVCIRVRNTIACMGKSGWGFSGYIGNAVRSPHVILKVNRSSDSFLTAVRRIWLPRKPIFYSLTAVPRRD